MTYDDINRVQLHEDVNNMIYYILTQDMFNFAYICDKSEMKQVISPRGVITWSVLHGGVIMCAVLH
jgi:hypothetical protein